MSEQTTETPILTEEKTREIARHQAASFLRDAATIGTDNQRRNQIELLRWIAIEMVSSICFNDAIIAGKYDPALALESVSLAHKRIKEVVGDNQQAFFNGGMEHIGAANDLPTKKVTKPTKKVAKKTVTKRKVTKRVSKK